VRAGRCRLPHKSAHRTPCKAAARIQHQKPPRAPLPLKAQSAAQTLLCNCEHTVGLYVHTLSDSTRTHRSTLRAHTIGLYAHTPLDSARTHHLTTIGLYAHTLSDSGCTHHQTLCARAHTHTHTHTQRRLKKQRPDIHAHLMSPHLPSSATVSTVLNSKGMRASMDSQSSSIVCASQLPMPCSMSCTGCLRGIHVRMPCAQACVRGRHAHTSYLYTF